MNRVGNSTQRFPKGRVVGGPIFLQRICRNSHRFILELLKNSIVQFNKTISIARFHEIETDGEFIFQQLY